MTPSPATTPLARLVCGALLALSLLLATPSHAQDATPEALFSEGVELFNAEQYREAVERFRQVFEIDPNPFMLFNIARCYHELGELETAAKYYDRSLALDGLPRDAKVEAIKRLDDIQIAMEVRRTTQEAARRGARAHKAAREAIATRAAVVTPPDTGAEETGSGGVIPKDPDSVEPGRGSLTWVGATLGILGVVAVGGGTWFALQVGDDLDRHEALVADYSTLQAQALASGDAELAGRALSMADDANALATGIEQDQRLSLALFAGGGALIIGGVVMLLVDSPDEADVTVIATPNGLAVVGLW
jgi:tetratricopeptide (TPR) repeat protein